MNRIQTRLGEADRLHSTAAARLKDVQPKKASVEMNNLPEDLVAACASDKFMLNFAKAAPMLFCAAVEQSNEAKEVRDMAFVEEMAKIRSMMEAMKKRIKDDYTDVDIIEYFKAAQMLEKKLEVLKCLNTVCKDDGPDCLTINIQGVEVGQKPRAMRIDIAKLRQAIKIVDNTPEGQRQDKIEDQVNNLSDINLAYIKEDNFID